jgi:hypothetical protein
MDSLSLSGREYANVKKVPTFISDGKITPAINQLDAFIKKLETDISKGWINPAEGNRLIIMARDLIAHLKPSP